MQQPDFGSNIKQGARGRLYDLYREHMGPCIPEGRGYWTLANDQTRMGSEIEQILGLGIITPRQFNGVDRNERIINRNRKAHPQSRWYIGSWISVLTRCEKNYRPGLIYLDTMELPSPRLIRDIDLTISLAPADTMIGINVVMGNPYKPGHRLPNNLLHNLLLRRMQSRMPEFVMLSQYNATGHTLMGTYVYKK